MLPLVPEAPARRDGYVELGARLGEERLWFRVPEERAGDLTPTCDPFVVGALFRAMELGHGILVRGPVSPSLLRGVEEYTALWHSWYRDRFAPIAVEAEEAREPDAPVEPEGAIAAFSGGVDSCFTVWRHTQGLVRRRRERIVAGLTIHGIDRPLRLPFDGVFERNGRLLGSVGVEAWRVATNLREFTGRGFYEASGAAVLACLLLFQRRFGRALIAASSAYPNLMVPSPSSPLSDHLLGTGAIGIVHDGAEAIRPEKVAAIGAWPEACRYLRVCFGSPDAARNCCRCEKCVRTILDFRAARLPLPEAFPFDVDRRTIRRLRLRHPAAVIGFENILALARRNGLGRERWVRHVRGALRRARLLAWVRALLPR